MRTVLARFKGGPLGGEERIIEYAPTYRAVEFVGRPTAFLGETAALPEPEFDYADAIYERGRPLSGRDGFEYLYVSQVPALKRRIRALEVALQISQDELLEVKFGPGYKDAAFEDGLGGW